MPVLCRAVCLANSKYDQFWLCVCFYDLIRYNPFNCHGPIRLANFHENQIDSVYLVYIVQQESLKQRVLISLISVLMYILWYSCNTFDICIMIQELSLHPVSAKVVHDGITCLLFLFVCFITTTKAITKDIRHPLTNLESAAFSKGIISIFLENSEIICSFKQKQLKKQMAPEILKGCD